MTERLSLSREIIVRKGKQMEAVLVGDSDATVADLHEVVFVDAEELKAIAHPGETVFGYICGDNCSCSCDTCANCATVCACGE